jgi:hypothetical protein
MSPRTQPITHVGYVVAEIEPAVDWAVSTFTAGPFFVISHMQFEFCTFRGEPASYDHTSAFGQWGPIMIELTVVHGANPPELAEVIGGAAPKFGHVGMLSDDLNADSAMLEQAGMPLFHTGGAGPIAAHWHDGRPRLGHHVEILTRTPQIEGFYASIKAASEGWDGSEPLRPGPGG